MQKFRIFNGGFCGPESIAAGLRAVERGEQDTVEFLLARHPTVGDGKSGYELVTVGRTQIGGQNIWRECGENGDANGSGSNSIIGSGYPGCEDVAYAAAVLTGRLMSVAVRQGWWIFRQPTDEQLAELAKINLVGYRSTLDALLTAAPGERLTA